MADVRLTAINPEDSSVVPVACNNKGELKLEEPKKLGDIDGDLTVTGKGIFEGAVISTIAPGVNGATNAILDPSGKLHLQGTIEYNPAIEVYNLTGASSVATVDYYGSATFAASVLIGGDYNPTADHSQTTINASGTFITVPSDAGSTDSALTIKKSSNDGSPATSVIFLNGDGSATFNGPVIVGSNSNGLDVSTNTSFRVVSEYLGGEAFNLRANGDAIFEGNATFAGGKCGFTSAGELFVTVRGKKYKTISVASGIMSWEEMTLRDDAQERLDDVKVQIDPSFGVTDTR